MSVPPLIEFHNATVWRGSTRVFDEFDLTIPQRQGVVILGPNGSGKTTLLKTINRELYPVAKPRSWVKILGQERWNVWQLRRHIGVVSQDLQNRYAPSTSAVEVVVSGFHSSIGMHGQLAERIDDHQLRRAEAALAEVGMAACAGSRLEILSTGQQRRCLLARALVHRPATLVLDEPAAGLDFAASFDYLRQIRRLAENGQNIVLATHQLNEIPPEIDRVVMLKAGRIVADGSKEQTLTAELLSEVYEIPVRVANVDGFYLAYPG